MNPVIAEMKPQRIASSKWQQVAIIPLDNIAGVVYIKDSDSGTHFSAMGFTRKAIHPAFNYYFHSAEKREAHVKQWVSRLVEREADKIAARAAKKAMSHKLVVGDVLNTSWGYDQTNVEFYQIVELKSKTMVMLREIAAIQHDDSYVLPAVDSFIGKPFAKRVHPEYNSCKISSCQTASPVGKDRDGNYNPCYETPFGMGH